MTLVPIDESFRELARVEALAREAFPPEEYLPPARLMEMARKGNFDFSALYDGAQFAGFTAVLRWEGMVYLFFLAVEARLRGQGYGRRALETLAARYPGVCRTVDFEMPDGHAPNPERRLRRRRFYLDNGYRPTGVFLSYLGVDYEVFSAGADFELARFQDMLASLEIEGFAPRYFGEGC